MFADELIVLDFETTGLSAASGDRITEVAALKLKNGRITERYQSLANCGVRVPALITELTGITQAMVDEAPPVRRVLGELLEFLGDTPVVAHNAGFDQKFFERECALAGRRSTHQPFICTMRLARRIYPRFPSHALPVLARRLKISYRGTAHRAEADAEVAAHVLFTIGREILSRKKGLSLDANFLRKLMRTSTDKVAVLIEGRAPEA